MTKEQHKYCVAILRHIKRSPDAWPFLKPVDYVALNIPHYPNIIKHPMDLSTIEKKLHDHVYPTVSDLVEDMKLMINNCYTFNGREHTVSILANNLEKTFQSQLRNMPQSVCLYVHSKLSFALCSILPLR